MATHAIVEGLDVVKNRQTRGVASGKGVPVDTFAFQCGEEAFHRGIVIAITSGADAGANVMLSEQIL